MAKETAVMNKRARRAIGLGLAGAIATVMAMGLISNRPFKKYLNSLKPIALKVNFSFMSQK